MPDTADLAGPSRPLWAPVGTPSAGGPAHPAPTSDAPTAAPTSAPSNAGPGAPDSAASDTTPTPGTGVPSPSTATPVPPDGTPAVPPSEVTPSTPGFATRGKLRRRLRYLRRVRELGYRDLGGLVFDQHRFARPNEGLVHTKVSALAQIDGEVRALEQALEDRRVTTELREAGIAACPRCGAIYGSESRFCPACGLSLTGPTELSQVHPPTAMPIPVVPAGTMPAPSPRPFAPQAATPPRPRPFTPQAVTPQGPPTPSPAPAPSAAEPPRPTTTPTPAFPPAAEPPSDQTILQRPSEQPTRVVRAADAGSTAVGGRGLTSGDPLANPSPAERLTGGDPLAEHGTPAPDADDAPKPDAPS